MSQRHRVPQWLLERARALREDSAPAERKLWTCLRNRKLNGHKFRRQHNLGPFIADFCCAEQKFIVELDGPSHDLREDYDRERTDWLAANACRVLRFLNEDVHQHLDAVLMEIARQIDGDLTDEKAPSP